MQKLSLFLLGLFLFTAMDAQKPLPSFARLIKYSLNDSLVPVSTSIKKQLLQAQVPRKKNETPRLIFSGADKKKADLTVRWLSSQIGKDVYKIDLSLVVSKYIGETEKNLELLFARAEDKDWILFFDEADSLFGPRLTSGNKEDTDKSITYFFEKLSKYKGVIAIHCIRKNCFDILAKKGFMKLAIE